MNQAVRIGLGMATLMREPSHRRRKYLMDLSYDIGIRHYDVAPAYGLGAAETELGQFLDAGHSDVSVATKVGLAPSALARLLAPVQAPLRCALRRSPKLRTLAKRNSPAINRPVPQLDATALRDGVQQSRVRLRGHRINYLFLHELPLAVLTAPVSTAVESLIHSNVVGQFGISGPATVLPPELSAGSPLVSAILTNDSLTHRDLHHQPGIAWFHYGVLGQTLAHAREALEDRELRTTVESVVGEPLRTKEQVARLLIVLAGTARSQATVLVGTTNPGHLAALVHGLDAELPGADAIARARNLLTPRIGH
ncbi:aldo/keto reductase [Cryptosporangium sp. NPDC048952]|uniref:aldo/keto reductase n=1 Tax=Cryptosporangium sp. NPDC048952 TaxID=3363961 RepID=UPI00371185B5